MLSFGRARRICCAQSCTIWKNVLKEPHHFWDVFVGCSAASGGICAHALGDAEKAPDVEKTLKSFASWFVKKCGRQGTL